ncbi:MAG TPA: MoaD/ThiS family protein [Spirochaetales bacterium]|nr:MoaD/ThiS family protein [Spirochaetales bacterium]HRY56175.1 MoaD/ThiS family protein [Spirochaetia bacterium]HRZ66072.1 MoaD/ThiS family protein [Spirochaetia bacterium]
MKVTIKLFASLRAGRFDSEQRELPAGSDLAAAITAAGVEAREAAVVFVNSRHAEPARPLAEGDVVAIFPPVGGG